MIMDEDITDAYISWQAAVSGPYSFKEIRSMLKLGKVHSLYRIQVDGEWVLLRDRLADIDRMARAPTKDAAPQLRVSNRSIDGQSSPPPIPLARVVPEDGDFALPTVVPSFAATHSLDPASSPATGIATASFILSLCFFIPILNGITQLLALIFGHLALAQMGSSQSGKSRNLASTGLWITYVQVAFLAASMAWLALNEVPNLTLGYIVMHGQMLGIALTALIGAGLLMLGIMLLSNHLLSFRVCFIGTLLPAAVSAFGIMVIQSLIANSAPASSRAIASIALLQVFMFAVQTFFWSQFIKLPNGEELGLGRAALASLFYSIVFIFIGVLYLMLFAALNSHRLYF